MVGSSATSGASSAGSGSTGSQLIDSLCERFMSCYCCPPSESKMDAVRIPGVANLIFISFRWTTWTFRFFEKADFLQIRFLLIFEFGSSFPIFGSIEIEHSMKNTGSYPKACFVLMGCALMPGYGPNWRYLKMIFCSRSGGRGSRKEFREQR